LEFAAVYLVTGEQQKTIISDFNAVILDALVFAAFLIAAKQSAAHSKHLAIGLGLICLAMFSNLLADISWGFIQLGLKQDPFPSIPDLFYLIYYPLILAGVFWLPRNRADRRENLRDCFISGRVRWENGQIRPNLPDRLEVYRMFVDYGISSAL